MAFFIFFTVITAIYVILSIRYRCPWQLYMVIGKKRSGKTTLATKLAHKYIRRHYVVYTNIADMYVPGVRYIDPDDLANYAPVSRSVLLLDEAGSLYDNRQFKQFQPGVRDFYIYQGHYRCIVWLFSQAHNVDKKLRDLTDRFYLVRKVAGVLVTAQMYTRTIKPLPADSLSGELFGEELHPAWLSGWLFAFIPYWRRKFDSFALQGDLRREEIPYTNLVSNKTDT